MPVTFPLLNAYKRGSIEEKEALSELFLICFSACYPFFCFLPHILPLLSLVCSMTAHKEKFLYCSRSTKSMEYRSRLCSLTSWNDLDVFSVVYFAYTLFWFCSVHLSQEVILVVKKMLHFVRFSFAHHRNQL